MISFARKHPFTVGGVALMTVIGLILGTFSTRVLDHAWGPWIAYGPEALAEGRWWTAVTGSLFAVTPVLYLAVLGSWVAFIGWGERVLGTARTAALWAYGQLVGVLGGAALIFAANSPLRDALDVGPSGGALAVAAVLTGTLQATWRRITQIGLVAYGVGSLLLIGHLADVVHLTAILAALPLAKYAAEWRRPIAAERTRRKADEAQLARVERGKSVDLLREHGGGTVSWMTTWDGMRYYRAQAGDGYVGYRVHLGVAIVLGDPVGSDRWRARATQEFAEFADANGWTTAWFSVSAETADRAGGSRLQVAEDNLLDLETLAFKGKKWQDIRTARNRAAKEGGEARMLTLETAVPAIREQVETLSAAWMNDKPAPELGFTLGGVDEAMDPRVRVIVAVDAEEKVHAVTSWLPVYGRDGALRGWTLDLMRRDRDGFRPAIEFLIAEACLRFQDEGADVVSLSGAPLVRSHDEPVRRLQATVERGAKLAEPLYGFGSLHRFKAKFQPRAEPMYLAYRRWWHLPQIGLAVMWAFLSTPRQKARLKEAVRQYRPSFGDPASQHYPTAGLTTESY